MTSSKESLFDLFITNEILMLLGVLIITIFFYRRRNRIHRRVLKGGVSVPGTIVKLDKTPSFFYRHRSFPIELRYEFQGKTYVHNTLIHRYFFDFFWEKRYYVGKVIEVFIDPDDPEKFITHHDIDNRASPPKETITYVTIIFWSLVIYYLYVKNE
ncbi:MAG: DUF3592 domain-containing protein [bacterium]